MNLNQLLKSLLALAKETEWVEFKHNNDNPETIGEYLSALSNSAALHGKDSGYLVWGVEDTTHKVVGTTVQPRLRKIGNEEMENWLAHNLSPRIDFQFHEIDYEGLPVVILRVQPTVASPVSFRGVEWIRVGSIKKKLKDHPGKEKELWLVLANLSFEQGIAASAATGDEVLARLDYPKYFELSSQALPDNRAGILERMSIDRLIVPRSNDSFDITSLGAILFAKQLSTFGSLARKGFRVVRYQGTNRVETEYEKLGKRGYAAGFEGLIAYINDHVPRNEVLGQALRRDIRMYPERAIRELVANSIIHQDFAMTGTGPMVEIFDDRMEVSNPGLPLIDPLRFIDHAPRSRNEMLADLMRRLGICEERGSGFDKVVFETEVFQLPAPDIRVDSTHTRIVLFGHQKLSEMDRLDKVRAGYQHCALLYVSNKRMTNSTLRERFQIPEREYFVASRIIRDTINAGLIKSEDSESKSRKHARYVPFWA
jgi:ATP-dependent DNA helicase RecG